MQAMSYCWDKPRVHIDIFLPCRWKHKAHNRCELIGPQKVFFHLLSDTGFTAAGQTEVIPPHRKRLKMECCGRTEKRLDAVRPARVMRKAVNRFSFLFSYWLGIFFFFCEWIVMKYKLLKALSISAGYASSVSRAQRSHCVLQTAACQLQASRWFVHVRILNTTKSHLGK